MLPAFNPDKFLTWLYNYTSFIYTRWFTAAHALAYSRFTAGSPSPTGRRSAATLSSFTTFSDKSWGTCIEFYLLAMVVLGFHEIGHGHACKHYGGRVPAMGFALIYLTPAFYTDTTEGEVKGSRSQRLVISLAGVWAELMIYADRDSDLVGHATGHRRAQRRLHLMLITGISAVLINWNPLIKLDGYYMLCEILGIVDLKEASTAYVSAWVKRHIWRLASRGALCSEERRLGYARSTPFCPGFIAIRSLCRGSLCWQCVS